MKETCKSCGSTNLIKTKVIFEENIQNGTTYEEVWYLCKDCGAEDDYGEGLR